MLGASRNIAWPQSTTQSVLSATEFSLEIGEMPVKFYGWLARCDGRQRAELPAPLLRWREGDTVTLRVSNRLPVRRIEST